MICTDLFYNRINNHINIVLVARYGKMAPSCGSGRDSSVNQVAHLILPCIYQCQLANSSTFVHVHHCLPPASSHSSRMIVSVLQCGDIIPEATSVLELLPSRAEARSKPDFPVIVIEGLDATGKTTLTESLKDTLGAALLRSPPQCLSPWRACFDQEPPLIRRAFYALGNYITAEQIGQEGMKTPVIVDRFWHSTAAYAIATAVSGPVCNLPAEGSEVYRWPTDLLQPSLVVLLTLDPEERKRRLRDRGQGKTEEEQKLDHNHLFRLRVEEAYRRIIGPACVTVDAGPSADQVLQQVQLLIRGKCHL